jgi:methylenetetrahydrofolate dehydrogenase (NADP+) / methenyltetrahydrofolate cyclohydrolase
LYTENDKIIDGKFIADKIVSEIKIELAENRVKPGLALIIAGNNPASESYVRMKEKKCAELGYYSVVDKLPETITENELLALVDKYNKDGKIHGILIQLPLPKHINELKILEAVNYKKDVDGFHPINSGRLVIGEKCFIPCTPAGIIELLKRYNINTRGENVVVLGRSNIVGKPIANLLYQKNNFADSTVTICHSKTKDIKSYTEKADIIIAAIGKPYFLNENMIKNGCVIIDVGVNRIEDPASKKGYRLVGDVDFESCLPKAKKITPVPGGVGPMTIAMLMKNTLDAALKRIYS